MATAVEARDQAGAPHQRVIHVLLAQTEKRLVATLGRYGAELIALRDEVAAALAMLDRAQYVYFAHTPEVPPEARDRALASGQRRFASWRRAVAGVLSASGRSVPPFGTDGANPAASGERTCWNCVRRPRGRAARAAGWGLTVEGRAGQDVALEFGSPAGPVVQVAG
jgi:hypothetical protein